MNCIWKSDDIVELNKDCDTDEIVVGRICYHYISSSGIRFVLRDLEEGHFFEIPQNRIRRKLTPEMVFAWYMEN